MPRPSPPGARSSQNGMGSRLPLKPLPRPSVGADGRVRGLRLLVVDDDPARLDALALTLRGMGAEVAVGGRVESGFSQAVKLMPDAVISDLASPGEPGWELVEKMRRHPLLRWTPVLLIRWWKNTASGEGYILTDRLLDRLEEVLAPLHVLSERIATGRPLSERIEATGPLALLRVFMGAGLRGMLSVNDSWSVYEVGLSGGELRSIVRRGVDGVVDEGAAAFLELLLCDAGRWSFRALDDVDAQPGVETRFDAALDRASQLLTALFGQDAHAADVSADRLEVRLDVLTAAASTLSTIAQQIAEAVAAGSNGASMNTLLREIGDPFEVERALQSLFRCGAVVPHAEALSKTRDKAESKAAGGVAYILRVVNDEPTENNWDAESNGVASDQSQSETVQHRGMYRVSEVKAERVATGKREALKVPGAPFGRESNDPGETRYPEDSEDTTPVETMDLSCTPIEPPDTQALEGVRTGSPGSVGISARLRSLIHDSLVPPPREADQSRKDGKQMWLAIGLALLLGCILVAGLILIASGGSDFPPGSPD